MLGQNRPSLYRYQMHYNYVDIHICSVNASWTCDEYNMQDSAIVVLVILLPTSAYSYVCWLCLYHYVC